MWPFSRVSDWLDRFGRPIPPSIVADDLGFTLVRNGNRLGGMRWSEVAKVIACKRDCGMYDEICLVFESAEQSPSVLVVEGDGGYESFVKCLEFRLPGSRTNWFGDVAFPAFETNVTTLYEYAPQQAPCSFP